MEEHPIDTEELRAVAQSGDLPAVVELVARGCAVNGFDDLGKTPLHYAVEHGHLAVAAFLIQAGADVNAHDERCISNTPLGEVAAACSLEIAALLVEAGADPTIPGWMRLTALDKACRRTRGDGPAVCDLLREAAKGHS